jgi:hypothetical protein
MYDGEMADALDEYIANLVLARAAYVEDLLAQAVPLQDYDRLDDLTVIEDSRIVSLNPTLAVSVASLLERHTNCM